MTHGERAVRIGILGGTLDPIHVGHVETALAARAALRLNSVIVMPARMPPHRQQGPSASMFHRFAMAALAANELADVTVSDEELGSDGPSYTALTLERLATRGLYPSQIFFILGADAFVEIETWHRYPAVLDLAHFVVISRPGVPVATIGDRLPHLRHRLRVADRRAAIPPEPSVFLVDARTTDVSSTEIRRRLRAGDSITGLVPRTVEHHIQRHGLYAETRTADRLQ
ncbi:MAG: nicotinate-nucleotide adenylyltransferase [Vicinamibacterales bacterium]